MDRRTLLRAVLLAGAAGCAPTGQAPIAAPTATPTGPGPPRPTGPTSPLPTDTAPSLSSSPSPSGPRQLRVVSRDLLGLPPAAAGGQPHEVTGLMLHHTAAPTVPTEQAPDRFRGHTRSHRDAGFVDIAYHWGVDTAGTVYQLRDEGLAGETFTDYDPTGWLLVVCEGNFEESAPPRAMLEAVADVFAARSAALGVDPSTLVGHRDLAATACPGINLQEQLPRLEAMIAERMGAVELVLSDDPAALP